MRLQEAKTVEDIKSFINCRDLIWIKQDYPFDLYRLYNTDYPISVVFTIDTIKWKRKILINLLPI